LRPRFAAPNVEVPIQVKVFVAADTGYGLFLTAHVTSDLVERCRRVEHGKTFFQPPNSHQRFQQLIAIKVDQVGRFVIDQGGRAERCAPRIGKRHVVEP
jgi:hypothetical protein